MRTALATLVVVLAVLGAGALATSQAPPAPAPKRLLFLTHAGLYKHTSLGPAEVAVTELGKTGGFEVTTVEGYKQSADKLDFSFLTPEYLARFDGLMLMTNGNLPLSKAQRTSLLDFVQQWKGLRRRALRGADLLRRSRVRRNARRLLFDKVDVPPATQPPTAFWHFGWHVTDVRKQLSTYRDRGVTLLPLYTGDNGGTVFVSSDTWPGTGGVLGLTKAGIADAKAKGVTPNAGAGFAYLRGPDDAMIEYQGNMPAERFNHVHMFQDQPFCAQLWYQSRLNIAAPARPAQPPRTEANCRIERGPDRTFPALDWNGMYRTPSVTSTAFGDVSLFWYMNQGDTPAASTRGYLMDHIALSVGDLDAWVAKLRAQQVTLLEPPYSVGGLRAVMIEGPSREAIEMVEIK